MNVHPIIFSATMVRALLGGRKTMTRRLAWGKEFVANPLPQHGRKPEWKHVGEDGFNDYFQRPTIWQRVKKGDQLWVRELHCFGSYNISTAKRRAARGQSPVVYGTDRDRMKQYERFQWRPSIHMPRWASRITLQVTETKREKLQDISPADCAFEGVGISGFEQDSETGESVPRRDYWRPFSDLWCELHGVDSWDADPEVVALRFEIITKNIDDLQVAA